jgi:hypothetical protein
MSIDLVDSLLGIGNSSVQSSSATALKLGNRPNDEFCVDSVDMNTLE